MSPKLRSLLDELDRWIEPIDIQDLVRILRDSGLTLEDVRGFAHFSPVRYQRNLIHEGPAYHALALCWRSGQRSPIHDHCGSACGVRVLDGVMTETVFERTGEGHVYPTRSRELRAGQVCATYDADIHQVSNLQPRGADLVTLHVYSPPLLVMGTYSLTDTAVGHFADPVVAFADGAGI
jgi:cysteine dioxygenase